MKKLIVCVLLAGAISNNACALEEVVGRVVVLEPTYLPIGVNFAFDAGNATCPAGRWLWWGKADAQNNKAVYALLLTAQATGKRIRLYINNGDINCVGQFIHLLD